MLLDRRIEIIDRQKLVDGRGWFLKIINGREKHLPQRIGEIYTILAKPNQVRAEHYHLQACEWFTLLQGKAELWLEDVNTREQLSVSLDAHDPQTIYVPNGVAHAFRNLSSQPFILITYSDRQYDPNDTISYKIVPQACSFKSI